MAAAPFRFLSLLREHQPEKGFFKWFAVSACNRNTLPGFHEDFGRVEMVYIRKVDKVTAVTLEKVVFFQELIFHNMKWSDGRDDLSCPQIKKHFFILGFGKFRRGCQIDELYDIVMLPELPANINSVLQWHKNIQKYDIHMCTCDLRKQRVPIVKGKQLCCDTTFRSPLSDQIYCIL